MHINLNCLGILTRNLLESLRYHTLQHPAECGILKTSNPMSRNSEWARAEKRCLLSKWREEQFVILKKGFTMSSSLTDSQLLWKQDRCQPTNQFWLKYQVRVYFNLSTKEYIRRSRCRHPRNSCIDIVLTVIAVKLQSGMEIIDELDMK